jgi:hypothetical protein
MNVFYSEEATNFKARSIALASALKIELTVFDQSRPAVQKQLPTLLYPGFFVIWDKQDK